MILTCPASRSSERPGKLQVTPRGRDFRHPQLGLRQGEALGLQWSDIDLDDGTLIVRRSRLRPKWKHGCTEPCGHRFGGHCPQRVPLRTETAGTKSKAGKRGIGLPDELVMLLNQHKAEQEHERLKAAQLWQETDYVFTTPTGGPLNPRTDYTEWKRLLERAGVPTARRPPRCYCFCRFRTEQSWRSWDGRTPRWPRGTNTSSRPSGETWRRKSADCSGNPARRATRALAE